MSQKGITPIIAIILLLLITISMVGFAFVWFSRVASISAERAENQTEQQFLTQQKTIRIDNAAGTSVTIRNTGAAAIRVSELAVFVNDVANSFTAGSCPGTTTISPGSVQSCTLTTACSAGSRLKITAPGNTDVVNCA